MHYDAIFLNFDKILIQPFTMHIEQLKALTKLNDSGEEFLEMFTHGRLSVEIYKPDQIDQQMPHDRDEFYVVISGTGEFVNGDKKVDFIPGDFLFVPAGIEHRFINFTNDFSTWVFFFGPKGGA